MLLLDAYRKIATLSIVCENRKCTLRFDLANCIVLHTMEGIKRTASNGWKVNSSDKIIQMRLDPGSFQSDIHHVDQPAFKQLHVRFQMFQVVDFMQHMSDFVQVIDAGDHPMSRQAGDQCGAPIIIVPILRPMTDDHAELSRYSDLLHSHLVPDSSIHGGHVVGRDVGQLEIGYSLII